MLPEPGKLYRSRSVPDHPPLLMVSVSPAPMNPDVTQLPRCYATWLESGELHSTNITLQFFWGEYEEVTDA